MIHPLRKRRLRNIILMIMLLGTGVGFILSAFNENLNLYRTPAELWEAPVYNRPLRIGGMVKVGSIRKDGLNIQFIVTDYMHEWPVVYQGITPDLFKEDSGVVMDGRLTPEGVFHASRILAKHDETYMPPKVERAPV